MAEFSYVLVYEEGITEKYTDKTTPNITVVDSTDSTNTFNFTGTRTVNNKKYALFGTMNAYSATISTLDAFEGITVELQADMGDQKAYVDLKKKNLYCWTIEPGASAYDNHDNNITAIYTDTPTPTVDTSTGAFSHLYNNLGEYYGGEGYSDIMPWALEKGDLAKSETYAAIMNDEIIRLKAYGPA